MLHTHGDGNVCEAYVIPFLFGSFFTVCQPYIVWGAICVKTINNPPNINGVLHIQMQCSIYKCSAPYTNAVLHIYMEHSIYIWGAPYIYGVLHIWSARYIIWSTAFVYGALHLYMEHSIYIWSTAFVYGALHLYLEDYL